MTGPATFGGGTGALDAAGVAAATVVTADMAVAAAAAPVVAAGMAVASLLSATKSAIHANLCRNASKSALKRNIQ